MFTEVRIPHKDMVLVGDITTSDKSLVTVLFLHGAGLSNISRLVLFREFLVTKGIHSCAFDFIGHGKTGGELLGKSLKERVEQTKTVIDTLGINPQIVIGSSMGAYIALHIVNQYSVEKVLLVAPGVFAERAYDISFGPDFSEILREKDSWKTSDAWKLLNKFTGSVLIYRGENDKIISTDIVEMIYDNATNAKNRTLITVPGAEHNLWSYFDSHQEYFEGIYQSSIKS